VTPSLTPEMVLDINPGGGSSNWNPLVAIDSTTYFAADDGVHGTELWKSDGTIAGTTLVKDIYPGTHREYDYDGNWSDGPNSSGPNNLTNVNGTLFFTSGNALWKSDGTAAGTTLVSSLLSNTSNLTNVNGTLFFTAGDPLWGDDGVELWKSDGTTSGTVMV